MRFLKAHGLGNDYLVLTEPSRGATALTADRVRALCDRHRGVGSDGILEPVPTDRADHGVRIWNPDGSIAEKSGNGLRIFAFWLSRDQAAGRQFTVDTGHDVVRCTMDGSHGQIEMGRATVTPGPGVELDGAVLDVTTVRVGNPHAVVWTEGPEPLDALPWRHWGATLEVDTARFPDRTNVQTVRWIEAGRIAARIWERGAGETLASGSSACAIAAVAVHRGVHPAGRALAVEMPGGALTVTVSSNGEVHLAGPVAPVGWVTVDPEFLGG